MKQKCTCLPCKAIPSGARTPPACRCRSSQQRHLVTLSLSPCPIQSGAYTWYPSFPKSFTMFLSMQQNGGRGLNGSQGALGFRLALLRLRKENPPPGHQTQVKHLYEYEDDPIPCNKRMAGLLWSSLPLSYRYDQLRPPADRLSLHEACTPGVWNDIQTLLFYFFHHTCFQFMCNTHFKAFFTSKPVVGSTSANSACTARGTRFLGIEMKDI
jgi:hypothetical protein